MSLLVRASLRHLACHPWQSVLSALGIALGVAVVVGIDLANGSARRAFTLAAEAVTGRATHQAVGGPSGLDEALYARLRVEAGVRPAAPVVEGWVGVPDRPGRALHLLGVDPLAEAPFRPYLDPWGSGGPGRERGGAAKDTAVDLTPLLTRPGTGVLSADTARDLGVAVGATLGVRVSGLRRSIEVIGLIVAGDEPSRRALDGLLVTDIATAQEVLGLAGRLSRIDLIVPDGPAGAGVLARVAGRLPPGAEVMRAAARTAFVEQVTRAFSVNLTALSLLALIVGMFLIYNTTAFSVVQRRAAIGRLRALGVTRGEVLRLLLGEAALVGLLGSAAGLALGVILGRGLVGLVTRTINDLYFVLAVQDLAIDPLALAKGAALGLGATLLAALAPALEATRAPPGAALSRAALEARRRRAVPRAALAGVVVLGLAAGLIAWPGGSLLLGYGGLFAVLLGAALLTPAAALGITGILRGPARRLAGVLGGLATGGVSASLSRTAVAIAALMVAVAATVGVGIMVQSFRGTVVRWLETSLVADVYVSAPSLAGSRAESTLDPRVIARLATTPGVASVGTYRGVRVASAAGPTQLVALGLRRESFRQFRFLAGDPARIWPVFQEEGAAIVSEPYAARHRVGVGARLRLRTDRGERELPVAGVFADYGSDQGVVMVSRRTYEALWDDRGVASLGIVAQPGIDVARLAAALRERAGPEQELLVRDTRTLRATSLQIFDRTFAITAVLRLLALVVAFVGVLSALMALQLERARELAVLRAQGLSPGQLWGVVTAQTGLMGLIAGAVAVPVGIALAGVLIFVINRRAFGWTLEAEVAPAVLLQAMALAVVAGLLAGVVPALRMARTPPAAGLREE